ncbi:MAG: YceH family protein [Crocinitomicaceae bacterium]
MDTHKSLSQLSAEEIRVLGALIEKSKTTPDYYPMTLNGLITACNQKSSRSPVVNFESDTVVQALDSLRKKELCAKVLGDGRTTKYRHTLSVKHSLDPAELTVLGLLFLRGPLTSGDINSMSGRMFDFEDLTEVQQTIQQLIDYETPFVQYLPKKTGQKEARLAHLFADLPTDEELEADTNNGGAKSASQLEERLEAVESQLTELQATFDALMKELS